MKTAHRVHASRRSLAVLVYCAVAVSFIAGFNTQLNAETATHTGASDMFHTFTSCGGQESKLRRREFCREASGRGSNIAGQIGWCEEELVVVTCGGRLLRSGNPSGTRRSAEDRLLKLRDSCCNWTCYAQQTPQTVQFGTPSQ